MLKNTVLFFLLLIHFNLTSAQTCIIAKINKNEIFVGADSRETLLSKNLLTQKWDTAFGAMCKIGSSGNFHFAVFHDYGKQSLEFASKAATKSNNFKELITEYNTQYGNWLLKYLS